VAENGSSGGGILPTAPKHVGLATLGSYAKALTGAWKKSRRAAAGAPIILSSGAALPMPIDDTAFETQTASTEVAFI